MMILAKMRVTARDVDDDKVLLESMVYVSDMGREKLPAAAIRKLCRNHAELNTSAVRCEAVIVASAEFPAKASAAHRSLLAFVQENAPTLVPEDLDESVHEALSARASEINNQGLDAQLGCLFEMSDLDSVLTELCDCLNAREED
jgi:hypothetical protein